MRLDVSQQFPVATPEADLRARSDGGPDPGSPFVTVPFLVAAVRRRWRFWVAAAACGLLLATALSLAVPPAHSASTTLLLVHATNVSAERAMLTDVALLETTTVARAAIDRLKLRMSPRKLVAQYRGEAVTDDLLKITVEGPTSAEAVRRADSVANAFLTFRRDELQRQSRLAVEALEERQRTLSSELAGVNNAINTTPPDQRNDAAVRAFGELLARRASLNDQISRVAQQIQDGISQTRAIVEKSRVIDPPTADTRSPLRALATNLVAGVVAGLFLGIGWVVVQEVATARVRLRDDVMQLLGAPVAVSVSGHLRGGRRVQRSRWLRHRKRPHPSIASVARHLRGCLSRAGAGKDSLVVFSVHADWPAALAAAATARELSDDRKRVLLVDLTQSQRLAGVLDIRPAMKTSAVPMASLASAPPVAVAFPGTVTGPEIDLRELRARADHVLVVASLNPARGARGLIDWATKAVVLVSAGGASAAALKSTAQLLRMAGLEIHSTVLLGADPTDETVGIPAAGADGHPVELPSLWGGR